MWEVDDALLKRSEVTTRARGLCDCEAGGRTSGTGMASCQSSVLNKVLPELAIPESQLRLHWRRSGREEVGVCKCAAPAWCRCRFPVHLFRAKLDAAIAPEVGKLSANEMYCRFLHALILGTKQNNKKKSAMQIKRKQSKFIRYMSSGQWLCDFMIIGQCGHLTSKHILT